MCISDLNLGATLYTPAVINILKAKSMITGLAYPDLKSMVICLEDSLSENQVSPALINLKKTLTSFKEEALKRKVLLFIRPRNLEMAKQILGWGLNDCFDGFVAPKFALGDPWLEIMEDDLYLMPTCEDGNYFDAAYRAEVRAWLEPNKERVLCLRVGGNDLLATLGIRRPKTFTIYDTPVGSLIQNMVGEFGSRGFALNSPVFEHFTNTTLLEKELALDLANGLLTKTAIHPLQIPFIQGAYRVDEQDLVEAETILAISSAASVGVCKSDSGSMLEPATHESWAKRTIERAQIYGVVNKVEVFNFA